ncbi:TonB-dependent receptor plug domain-containing protein, partial [Crocinitomicaceae bacterium]|nr:TonB-dependent receptor plug domain-containing protein [Crocinitomicaceae bacterium]
TEEGIFELVLPKFLPDTMVISARGYFSDTIIVDKKDRFLALNVVLYSEQLLPEVIVEYKRKSFSISRLKVLHVEELSSSELKKAACCNLGESFETNASVDVNMTDAVSGAKKIQMMGLEGIYTQIQFENIPYLRGLESSFGLETIPGTWIESIQITKGAGNVVNGNESMAGLINLELEKPETMDRFFMNAYQNRLGRSELNFRSGLSLSEKWSAGIFGYVSSQWGEVDENGDSFMDIPQGSNLSALGRFDFEGDKMEAKLGFNIHEDIKNGGQLSSTANPYGVQINNSHFDLFTKTGFFGKKPSQSLGIITNWKYQLIDGNFGNRSFAGEEKRGYVNIIYDDIIKTSDHKIKTGLSYTYIDINQTAINQTADTLDNSRIENIPGAFFEYTFTGSRLTTVFGMRYDYHLLFGQQIVPRVHLKYKLSEYTDFRLTSGKGWRVPNYIMDNISLLANSYAWVAPIQIIPEVSWNVGGSIYQEFDMKNNPASITVDFYRTWFENQLVVDRENDLIRFSNLENQSVSNTFQAEVSIEPIQRFVVRCAYKYLDVRSLFGDSIQAKVMIPKHRGFLNLAYTTRNKRWDYDLTLSVFGKARLAATSQSSREFSDVFPRLNAQVTYKLKKWDFYLGGENLTNYRQENPIIEPENPFGPNFDATRAWGPIIGYNIYVGLRYSIKRKNDK